MSIATRAGVVVLALCFLGLLALLPWSAATAHEGAAVSTSDTPFRWKIETVGVGYVDDFTERYLVSSGPGSEDWPDYPARDLFLHDFLQGTTRQLTSTSSTESYAALWDDKLIYATGPHPHAAEAGPWWVSLYDLTTGSTQIVSFYEDAWGISDLQASDGYAAWTVSGDGYMDLWLHDFASATSVCLSSEGTRWVQGFSLADGKLAWIDGSSLLLRDLATTDETVVSTSESDSSWFLAVAGDRVAWRREMVLLLYDLSSGQTEVISDRVDDFDLSVDHLVWTETPEGENPLEAADIYLRDLSSGSQVRLTDNAVADLSPQVSDRFAVWMRGDYHGAALLAYDLESGSTSTITSEGPQGAAGFRLEDDRVAWYGWRGLGDVYLARPVAFLDVDGRPDISVLTREDIVHGYDDGTFRPDNPVLRAQMAKMLVGALDISVDDGAVPCTFADVPAGPPSDLLYPDDFVAVAAANKIVEGFDSRTFKPYVPVTRIQMTSMVVRALERLRPGRLEQPPAGWDFQYAAASDPIHGQNVRLAQYNGLLNYWAPWEASLYEPATRGEMAAMLYMAFGGEFAPLRQTPISSLTLAEVEAELRAQFGTASPIYLPQQLPSGWGIAQAPLAEEVSWTSDNPYVWTDIDDEPRGYRIVFTDGDSTVDLTWPFEGDPSEGFSGFHSDGIGYDGGELYCLMNGYAGGSLMLHSPAWERETVLAIAAAIEQVQ